jgi:hypothetical protein
MNHDESWLEDIALAERAVHHINRLRTGIRRGVRRPDQQPRRAHARRRSGDPHAASGRLQACFRSDEPRRAAGVRLWQPRRRQSTHRPLDRSLRRRLWRRLLCLCAPRRLLHRRQQQSLQSRPRRPARRAPARLARRSSSPAPPPMPARHIILFCHHPLFFRDVDEPDESDEFGVTHFVENGVTHTLHNSYFHVPLKHRRRVVDLLSRFGCKLVFTGHWHRNAVARCPTSGVTVVTTTAVGKQLADDQPGMRLVSVTNDGHPISVFHAGPARSAGAPVKPRARARARVTSQCCNCRTIPFSLESFRIGSRQRRAPTEHRQTRRAHTAPHCRCCRHPTSRACCK